MRNDKGGYLLLIVLGLLFGWHSLSAKPYTELNQIRTNSSFGYEQYQMPVPLRALLAVIDVVRYAPKKTPYTQCAKIEHLLSRYDVPAGATYVAHEFAPDTYCNIAQMCKRLNTPVPLLFVANRGQQAGGVTICRLGVYHYGIVLGSSFLRRRTVAECRAVVAYKLAQIARKDCEKSKITRVVFPAIFCGGGLAYGVYRLGQALQETDKAKRWQPIKDEVLYSAKSWGLWVAALGATWLVSELIHRHLSRKYARQADADAVHAFGGDADRYANCLQRAHNDEQLVVQRKRGVERSYYLYVANKIEQLAAQGTAEQIICFLREALENCRRNQEKMTTSSPLHSWFAKTPSLDNRLAHVRSVGQQMHNEALDDDNDSTTTTPEKK